MQLILNSQSPFARKVRIVLYEKDVPFEAVELECAADRARLQALAPRAEVPVLVTDAGAWSGSREICDYLEARCPEPRLVPSDPALRARAAELERVADSYADALQFLLHLIRIRPELAARVPDLSAALERAIRSLYRSLDSELGLAEHFAGEFSRADVALFTQLSTLSLGCALGESHARLRAWFARMLARDAVRRDAREARAAYERAGTLAAPFFAPGRMHWRDARIEWAIRFGLGPWLLEELDAGRAFFSPAPLAG